MTNYSYKTILTKFSDENKDLIIKLFIEPFAIIITCILQKTKISANHITHIEFNNIHYFFNSGIFSSLFF